MRESTIRTARHLASCGKSDLSIIETIKNQNSNRDREFSTIGQWVVWLNCVIRNNDTTRLLTVTKYLSETHELECRIEDGPNHRIVVDPFVTCAVTVAKRNFRVTGRIMVGRLYKMEEWEITPEKTFLPNIFEEIL